MPEVIIVGGGIAGLAAAEHLKDGAAARGRDIDLLVLEKQERVGGKIVTERRGGFLIEGGPDSFLPEKVWTVNLAESVGLGPEMLPSNDCHKGTFIYSRARLHPLPEGVMLMVPTAFRPMAASRLISWPGKLRMGMELFIPIRPDNGDESLASFVTRRLGKECLERIAEPLVAGIHTSDPDEMSVLATFPRFVQMERQSGSLIRGMLASMRKRRRAQPAGPRREEAQPASGRSAMTYFMSFKEGMESLPRSCATFLGNDSIRLGAAAASIERKGAGYAVVLESGEILEAKQVILATPSYESARLVRGLDADLAAQLDRIAWTSVATVSLAFKRGDFRAPLGGFGFIVPRTEGRRINAATYSSLKWSYRAPEDHLLLRCFVGGGHHEELVDELDDSHMTRTVLEELDAILGLAADPQLTRIFRWPRGMPKYTIGHLDRMAALERSAGAHPSLGLVGSSYRGIGIGDCIHEAQLAAERILGE